MLRIDYFNWVRDIPYRCPLSVDEPDHCCLGKHKVLEKLLKRTGLEVRPRVCDSDWSSLNLPQSISALPHSDDIYHVYLEFKMHGKWHNLDASLDRGLVRKFPLLKWDGYSSTGLCIGKPKGKIYSPKESRELYMEKFDEDYSAEFTFYSALNTWFERIRQGKE